jgi:hypothetical protein
MSAGLLVGLLGLAAGAPEEPRWHEDYEQARAEARRTGKPLFVVFRCRH